MDLLKILFLFLFCAVAMAPIPAAAFIGVNYGTLMSHSMLPSVVSQMIKANGISMVKLFDADPWTLSGFVGTNIQVMVGVPNDQLSRMSSHYGNAEKWVKENVTRYDHDGGIKINYVAVGNEPFLHSYNGSFMYTTFPALKNIQKALDKAGVGHRIKATIPLNADVYNSPSDNPVPSGGDFRSDIHSLMVDIVRFLDFNGAPFVVNIYPFLSLYQNPNFPVDYAFFDGGSRTINDGSLQYTNGFDANYDTLVWALKGAGAGKMKIIVGEAGWPTDGDKYANYTNAKRFYDGFLKKLASNKGTPMRPGPLDVYLFSLVDENMKSIMPGSFERHWGIFTYDGRPKFPMDLSGKGHDKFLKGAVGVQYLPKQWCVLHPAANDFLAIGPNMDYACSRCDCTALGAGSSCNTLDSRGMASYAFNMYFQMQDQDVRACNFGGLATITSENASQDGCLFPVQILSEAAHPEIAVGIGRVVLLGIAALVLLWTDL